MTNMEVPRMSVNVIEGDIENGHCSVLLITIENNLDIKVTIDDDFAAYNIEKRWNIKDDVWSSVSVLETMKPHFQSYRVTRKDDEWFTQDVLSVTDDEDSIDHPYVYSDFKKHDGGFDLNHRKFLDEKYVRSLVKLAQDS